MKKIILFSVLFISSSIFALAVQGTCSSHGGVNCKVGYDWDGSVICNDNWRDSSEMFYDTKMCTEELHSCSSSEYQDLLKRYNIEEKRNKATSLSDQISMISVIQNKTTSQLREDAIKAVNLSSEIQSIQLDIRSAMLEVNRECYSLGGAAYYKKLSELIQKNSELILSLNKESPQKATIQIVTPLDKVEKNNLKTPFFIRTLKKGMSGQDIKQLQELLIKTGYLPVTHIPSTYFGTVTSNAVIKFQKDNAITPANGSFGPLTQKKLLSASEKPKVVTNPAQTASIQNQAATTSTVYDDNLKTDLYGATIVITTSPNYKMVNIVNATKNGIPGRFNKSEKTFISDEELYQQSKQTEIEIQKLNAR